MHGERRHRARRAHPASLFLLLVALGAVAYVIAHLGLLLLAGGTAVAAGIWVRRRPARPVPWVIQGRGEPVGPPEAARLRVAVGQLEAERDDLRRQVAKLEDAAARHDQLVGDLEDAAGRPIEAIIASYRHVQRQYGPAAVCKSGRQP